MYRNQLTPVKQDEASCIILFLSYALARNENKAINKSYGVNKMHKFLIANVCKIIIFKSRLRFEVKTKNKCGHLAEVTNFHMSLD
uniref:Uncharacterized protein n=1 Tax=Glossina palpalis gambiensis TaxID=67801 RepID=A0A1B0BRR9_9MUSC